MFLECQGLAVGATHTAVRLVPSEVEADFVLWEAISEHGHTLPERDLPCICQPLVVRPLKHHLI
jgi:hypothetical protein